MKVLFRKLFYLPIVLPFVFTVVFFGYLPPKIDAVIYTDNIVGEGTCSTYLSSEDVSFAYLYEGESYFGSELKTLRLPGLNYNISEINLYIYGVEAADILSFDVSVLGLKVTHLSNDGITHPIGLDRVRNAVKSSEEPLLHMQIEDPQKGSSVCLSGFDFIPGWIWALYFLFILIISIIVSVGFFYLAGRYLEIVPCSLDAAAIMTSLICGSFFCGSMPYVNYADFLLNWFLLFAACLLINSLSPFRIGGIFISIATLLWYLINFFVISFRNKPIMPSDIKALKTAFEVADGYSFKPTWQMIVGTAVVLAYCIVGLYCDKKKRKESIKKRLVALCASAVMLFIGINNPIFKSLNESQWDARVLEGFHREGILLTFVKSTMSSYVPKPDEYSKEAVRDYLLKIKPKKASGKRPVRIIMVMNEAFCDLRTVGLDDRIDVMPFIDTLKTNTVEGSLYSSVYGGGTCNTEFEALTGNTLAFLGTGAYPYTENVTEEIFSLASYFNKLDYESEAFHSNDSVNWNRNVVYPNLGFDIFHDISEYPVFTEDTVLHGHPADISDYLFMEKVDEGLRGRKRFLFDVTMQNHSGYERFDDVTEDETVIKYGNDLHIDSRVYLSLIKASDDAIKRLVEYCRSSDEPTMVVFFGDHQPGLSAKAQEGVYNSLNGNLDYFKTRFFIWTNYSIKEKHGIKISANYLPWLILKTGNFDMPPYVVLLGEVHKKYPVISSQGVIDSDGREYASVKEVANDPIIIKYRNVQYANLFDKPDNKWFESGR